MQRDLERRISKAEMLAGRRIDPAMTLLGQVASTDFTTILKDQLQARLDWLESIHGIWPSTWEPPAWWKEPIPNLEGSPISLGSVYGIEALQLEDYLHPRPEIRLPCSTDPGFDCRNPNACLRKV